jgi:hypothetical protein
MPDPDAGHHAIAIDLDGDHVADQIIPRHCNDRGNCTLELFVIKNGCPFKTGSLDEVQEDIVALPLTSRGLALLRTRTLDHDQDTETVYGWNAEWKAFYEGCLPHPGQDAGTCGGKLKNLVHEECLGGPAPSATFDVDGDGTADGIYHVPCPLADSHACGNWLFLSKPHCNAPAALLPDGDVTVATPAKGDLPAVLHVTGGALGARAVDVRFAATGDYQSVTIDATRTCEPKKPCGKWISSSD